MEPLFYTGQRVVVREDLVFGEEHFFEHDDNRPFITRKVDERRYPHRGTEADIIRVRHTEGGHWFYNLDFNPTIVWVASMLRPIEDEEEEYDVNLNSVFA